MQFNEFNHSNCLTINRYLFVPMDFCCVFLFHFLLILINVFQMELEIRCLKLWLSKRMAVNGEFSVGDLRCLRERKRFLREITKFFRNFLYAYQWIVCIDAQTKIISTNKTKKFLYKVLDTLVSYFRNFIYFWAYLVLKFGSASWTTVDIQKNVLCFSSIAFTICSNAQHFYSFSPFLCAIFVQC